MSRVLSVPAEGTLHVKNNARRTKVTVSADRPGPGVPGRAPSCYEGRYGTPAWTGACPACRGGGMHRGRCTTRGRSSRTSLRRSRSAVTAWRGHRGAARSAGTGRPGRHPTRWSPGWSPTSPQGGPRALKAIRAARSAARERARALAGDARARSGRPPVTIDLDATIVIAHSEKEQAAPTWRKTFGPMTAWADHAAAVHRHRRPPVYLPGHQHQRRAAPGPGTAAPPPRPRCEDRIGSPGVRAAGDR